MFICTFVAPTTKRSLPLNLPKPRPWAKKSKLDAIKEKSEGDDLDKLIIEKLSTTKEPDDSVMLFLKSMAPKLRELPSQQQFDVQMEIMQLLQKASSAQPCKPAAVQPFQQPMTPAPAYNNYPSTSGYNLPYNVNVQSNYSASQPNYAPQPFQSNSSVVATALPQSDDQPYHLTPL